MFTYTNMYYICFDCYVAMILSFGNRLLMTINGTKSYAAFFRPQKY